MINLSKLRQYLLLCNPFFAVVRVFAILLADFETKLGHVTRLGLVLKQALLAQIRRGMVLVRKLVLILLVGRP